MSRHTPRPARTAPSYPTLTQLRYRPVLHSVGLASALATLGMTVTAQAQEAPQTTVSTPHIAEMQMSERIPSTGEMTVYLDDASYAGLSLRIFGYLNAPLDRSFLNDPGALDHAIYEVLSTLSCEALDEPATRDALREAIQALMDQPEQLSHVALEVSFCQLRTHTRGMIRHTEFSE